MIQHNQVIEGPVHELLEEHGIVDGAQRVARTHRDGIIRRCPGRHDGSRIRAGVEVVEIGNAIPGQVSSRTISRITRLAGTPIIDAVVQGIETVLRLPPVRQPVTNRVNHQRIGFGDQQARPTIGLQCARARAVEIGQ